MKAIAHDEQPPEEWRAGVMTRMRISARVGAAQLCVFEQWVEPEAGAPTHWPPVEEVLTVIAGKAEMWLDEERAVLTAGHSLIIPPGRRHGFRNLGPETLHIEAIVAAPFVEATFEGAAEPRRSWFPDAGPA